ncbi:MAG: glycosyl hydrolase family 28-related protein, partial [Kiritimatiellia bacterium]
MKNIILPYVYRLLKALFLIVSAFSMARGEDVRFPPEAEVVNVVETYGVDNTGTRDVTEVLNRIWKSHRKRPSVLFFPKGTYLVSGMVQGTQTYIQGDHSEYKAGPLIIGENRDETIIRLKDGTWPDPAFDVMGKLPRQNLGQVVLHNGDANNVNFYQIIENLTVNLGRGNAGAIGVAYMTSNTGHLSNVRIKSEDGQGHVGLALLGIENGPGTVRNVEIEGFDYGIVADTYYQMVLHDLRIQSKGPALHSRGRLVIEDLVAERLTPGPVIVSGGWFTLVGAELKGTGTSAIQFGGPFYARSVETSGFDKALETQEGFKPYYPIPDTAAVGEYVAGEAAGLFGARPESLKLPVRKTPKLDWETDASKWTSIRSFKTPDNTWTE